jgi:hypothetical protein
VVNTDNYYTSPEVAVALSERNVYIRGTCRANRAGFPAAVKYGAAEASKVVRGTHKMVSDAKYGITCYGWIDGNPVTFLTSADGSVTNEVTRRIGRIEKKVNAPLCIKRYNKGMQAVDRHDQLRQTFSLAGRHGFKKYYVKIVLGLIDMALVNAYIHYKLVHPEECKPDSARYDFMESLADDLLTMDWENFANSESGISNDSIFQAIVERDEPALRTGNSSRHKTQEQKVETSTSSCVPCGVRQFMTCNNQKNGFACQVCIFEERGRRIGSVVVCTHHCLRLCVKSYDSKKLYKKDGDEIEDYSWMAPNKTMSCWEKAHSFYIPNGLFTASPRVANQDLGGDSKMRFVNVKVSSDIYNKKRAAFGAEAVKRGGPRGRSKKGCKKLTKSGYFTGDLVVLDSDDSEALAYMVASDLEEEDDTHQEEV